MTSANAAFTVRNAPVRFTSIMLCQLREIHLFDGSTRGSSSVGDDDIDRAVRFARRTRHGAQSASFVTSAIIAVALARLAATFSSGVRASAGQRNGGTLARQRTCDCSADAGAAPGDQCVSIVEHTHQTFPVIVSGRDLRR